MHTLGTVAPQHQEVPYQSQQIAQYRTISVTVCLDNAIKCAAQADSGFCFHNAGGDSERPQLAPPHPITAVLPLRAAPQRAQPGGPAPSCLCPDPRQSSQPPLANHQQTSNNRPHPSHTACQFPVSRAASCSNISCTRSRKHHGLTLN